VDADPTLGQVYLHVQVTNQLCPEKAVCSIVSVC
jgi:hypothetical protein